jgi:hypothetical protein
MVRDDSITYSAKPMLSHLCLFKCLLPLFVQMFLVVLQRQGAVHAASREMTVHEFRQGVRRNRAHYVDLKDDKYFSS